ADGANDESFSTLGFSDTSDIDFEPGVAQNAEGKPLCSREVYILASSHVPAKEGTASGPVARGEIKKVFADQKRLIVTDTQGEDSEIKVAEQTKLLINKLPGQLETLKPGDVVWIAYEQRDKDHVATEMHVSNRRRFMQVRGVEDPLIAAQVHNLELHPGGHWF